MKLFDAHTHLDDDKFARDLEAVVRSAQDVGLAGIMNAAYDLHSSQAAIRLAEKYPFIYAAVGIHPHDASTLDDEALLTLELMAKNKRVKAIGEIGLDYYRDLSPRDVQREAFEKQIALAKKLALPIIIHDRDAHGDVFQILKSNDAFVNGLQMHSYSSSAELAMRYVDLGAHISISGPVTYKNASVKREVVAAVPLDRLLIETDAPYLTPEPKRGMRNEPAYVRYVAEKIAEIKGITPEEVAEATYNNACKLFRIPQ
ncbi:MAG: TatD family hydrolase [Bacillota bacterium]|nr:TatD family hydrolase [Bacillota bacterium]